MWLTLKRTTFLINLDNDINESTNDEDMCYLNFTEFGLTISSMHKIFSLQKFEYSITCWNSFTHCIGKEF